MSRTRCSIVESGVVGVVGAEMRQHFGYGGRYVMAMFRQGVCAGKRKVEETYEQRENLKEREGTDRAPKIEFGCPGHGCLFAIEEYQL